MRQGLIALATEAGLPKRPRARATSALPSRDDILAYLARESERGATIGKREIARAFAVKGADRIGLKALLKEMEAQGLLDRRRKTISGAGALPATLVAVISGTTQDGDLFATPADWDVEAQGAAPRILIHLPRRAKGRGSGTGPARQCAAAHRKKPRRAGLPLCRPGHQSHPARKNSHARHLAHAEGRIGTARSRSTRRRKGAKSRSPRPISAKRVTAISSPSRSRQRTRTTRPRARPRPFAREGARAPGLARQREGGEPHRALRPCHPACVLARGPRRSRARPAGKPRGPRGLARRCRSSPSIRPTPRTMTTPCTRAPMTIRATPAASCCRSRSPMWRRMCIRAPRSIEKRSSAATRSIFPIAWCRCCLSASRTICARCARMKIALRSRSKPSSTRRDASCATPSTA